MNSMSLSLTSMGSSLPSPSLQDPFDLDTTCSEALEENWVRARICLLLNVVCVDGNAVNLVLPSYPA